jgi:hypothetical protein
VALAGTLLVLRRQRDRGGFGAAPAFAAVTEPSNATNSRAGIAGFGDADGSLMMAIFGLNRSVTVHP